MCSYLDFVIKHFLPYNVAGIVGIHDVQQSEIVITMESHGKSVQETNR